LCGATRDSSRAYAAFADVSVSESTPTSSTYFVTSGAAPEYAMIGWSPYWRRIRGSVVRALRTGPTRVGAWHWYSDTNRVRPPSTSSS
jgi:hypothetical protein